MPISAGILFSCGSLSNGKLGRSPTSSPQKFGRVTIEDPVLAVATGAEHVLAMTDRKVGCSVSPSSVAIQTGNPFYEHCLTEIRTLVVKPDGLSLVIWIILSLSGSSKCWPAPADRRSYFKLTRSDEVIYITRRTYACLYLDFQSKLFELRQDVLPDMNTVTQVFVLGLRSEAHTNLVKCQQL